MTDYCREITIKAHRVILSRTRNEKERASALRRLCWSWNSLRLLRKTQSLSIFVPSTYLCQSNCVYCSINIHYCVTLNRIVKVIQSAAQCYYCSNYLKLRKVFVINYMVHRLVTGPEPPYCAQRD